MNKPTFELEVQAQVNQLGAIESNMTEIQNKAKEIKSWYENLVITEEMIPDMKKEKADINKAKTIVSDYRKKIVAEFNKPLELFTATAKEAEKTLGEAYTCINNQIGVYEQETINKKTEDIKAYFNEYAQSLNIDFATYEQANINVNLSASMKSSKEAAKTFLDKIASDLELIEMEDESIKTDILIEYKKSLNASASIIAVKQRAKAKEEEIKRQEAIKELKAKEEVVVQKVEEVIAPVEIKEEQEKKYSTTFTVLGTIDQIKGLKQYMEVNNIEYKAK